MSDASVLDCAIVGAGPAGLTAATYLRRFRRDIVLLDAGQSRARWIPTSHNCPGFPSGVSGESLLTRMRAQARDHGADTVETRVASLARDDDAFTLASDEGRTWRARRVILATGVVDVVPKLDRIDVAIDSGVLRICAICDALEASDHRIVIFGPPQQALGHALFLRTFSERVCVLASSADDSALDPADVQRARDGGVEVLQAPARLEHLDGVVRAHFPDASTRDFDVVYPSLGASSQTQLALPLGVDVADDGALLTDAHQQTSVPGLYAIGDVVSALNQIAVAVGHAAIAATAVHNALPRNFRAQTA